MDIGAGVTALLRPAFHRLPDVVRSQYTLNGIALFLTVVSGVFQLGMGRLMYGYFITDKYYNQNIRLKVAEQTP
jgi:hypothetical protein